MELTQEYLKQCLDYNPDTGVFTWKIRPLSHFNSKQGCNRTNSQFAGTELKKIDDHGYIRPMINGKHIRAHRLAWLYIYGYMPINQIDHVNCIRSDNRIVNLREATPAQNNQNKKKPCKNNMNGSLGVSFYKRQGLFVARIKDKGKSYFLGYFNTEKEASDAYISAKRQLHEYGTL